MKTIITLLFCLALITAGSVVGKNMNSSSSQKETATMMSEGGEGNAKAMFAGGCFWCMEKPFEKLEGVVSVISGYAGGHSENPMYSSYMGGGHIEVVEITYDPEKISYEELLRVYWMQVDPTDSGGQFVDRGHGYKTAIFTDGKEQQRLADESKEAMDKLGIFGGKIVTPILPYVTFYPAEQYHQDYYKKNPIRYRFYRSRSGRDQYLAKIWGKQRDKDTMAKKTLKAKLTPLQYKITQEDGTEPPFNNEYWNNKKAGIYVDIVSNEPLFSSLDKYDSGTGWPSFSKPLVEGNVVEKEDRTLFSVRTEVRSKGGNSHLGHVFDDGPGPTGLRYCINSASLRFIPVEKLQEEGFAEMAELFR